MGQKVHPIGFRLGVNVGNRYVKEWQGRWYADKDYTKLLHEDLKVRQLIMSRLAEAGVSRVDIERSANQMTAEKNSSETPTAAGERNQCSSVSFINAPTITAGTVAITIQSPSLDASPQRSMRARCRGRSSSRAVAIPSQSRQK